MRGGEDWVGGGWWISDGTKGERHNLSLCLYKTHNNHMLSYHHWNKQTDTPSTCISPEEMSGVPHVLFEDLQIGLNKDPQGSLAYEKSLKCCGRGCVVGWSCVWNRQQALLCILWTLPERVDSVKSKSVKRHHLSWFPKKCIEWIIRYFLSLWLQAFISYKSLRHYI